MPPFYNCKGIYSKLNSYDKASDLGSGDRKCALLKDTFSNFYRKKTENLVIRRCDNRRCLVVKYCRSDLEKFSIIIVNDNALLFCQGGGYGDRAQNETDLRADGEVGVSPWFFVL